MTLQIGGSGPCPSSEPANIRTDELRENVHDPIALAGGGCGAWVFTTLSPLAAEGLPPETHKLLPTALAIEAAQTAIATCKGQGYNVSVSIADRSDRPQLLIAGDDAGPSSREVARRKAYTAAALSVCPGRC